MGARSGPAARGASSTARMGRPPSADRETIVRAAVETGFARLTMAAVGKRVGVSHSTLYYYFRGRQELAAAAVDHAVNAIDWPLPGEDWRTYLTSTAWAHWELYTNHPGLAKEITALRITAPALVRRDNRTGLALLGLGFEPDDAMLVVDMLAELVTQGFLGSVPEADTSDEPEGDAGTFLEAAQRRRRELTEPWLELYDERLREVLSEAVSDPPSRWFERKLTLFLDGVATRCPHGAGTPTDSRHTEPPAPENGTGG